MWILFAFGSALFAGLTAILAKIGIKDTDSDVATAIRTVVVLLFSWLMAWITGSIGGIGAVSGRTWLFLTLSGFATGASWLCYFRALQLGDVNKVTPVDKSSTVLTMLLAFLFLGEPLTWLKGLAIILIGGGAYLMIQRKAVPASDVSGGGEAAARPRKSPLWLLYALGSAVFASLTAILGKIGIENVNSTLGTAIRTGVVLVLAWAIVFGRGKQKAVPKVDR
ncbi:MAG: EamA family transporter, partial [Eubacteriales bacterium]|nr:EamA family transporter [Eubacteriales bacterium]